MKNKQAENIFKVEAKIIVDTLFDTKVFKQDITRDDMLLIEEFISLSMADRLKLKMNAKRLMDKIEKNKY